MNQDNTSNIFLQKMVTHYNKREYDEIERILISHDEKNKVFKYTSENNNGSKYYDENSIVDVRVWLNNETKRCLDVLYYVCKDDDMKVKINSSIIKMWLFHKNTVMSQFFDEAKELKKKREIRTEIKVENEIWKEIIKRCKLMSVSVNEGFNMSVNFYVKQKSVTYL